VTSFGASFPTPQSAISHVPPLANWLAGTSANTPDAAVYVGGAIITALIVLVIWPAVWSSRPDRRRAAKGVLDSLLKALDTLLRSRGR
jgi:hypothetical protein